MEPLPDVLQGYANQLGITWKITQESVVNQPEWIRMRPIISEKRFHVLLQRDFYDQDPQKNLFIWLRLLSRAQLGELHDPIFADSCYENLSAYNCSLPIDLVVNVWAVDLLHRHFPEVVEPEISKKYSYCKGTLKPKVLKLARVERHKILLHFISMLATFMRWKGKQGTAKSFESEVRELLYAATVVLGGDTMHAAQVFVILAKLELLVEGPLISVEQLESAVRSLMKAEGYTQLPYIKVEGSERHWHLPLF